MPIEAIILFNLVEINITITNNKQQKKKTKESTQTHTKIGASCFDTSFQSRRSKQANKRTNEQNKLEMLLVTTTEIEQTVSKHFKPHTQAALIQQKKMEKVPHFQLEIDLNFSRILFWMKVDKKTELPTESGKGELVNKLHYRFLLGTSMAPSILMGMICGGFEMKLSIVSKQKQRTSFLMLRFSRELDSRAKRIVIWSVIIKAHNPIAALNPGT